jgi:hypothetical protein
MSRKTLQENRAIHHFVDPGPSTISLAVKTAMGVNYGTPIPAIKYRDLD